MLFSVNSKWNFWSNGKHRCTHNKLCFRPRAHVSGYFWIRNFFFPDIKNSPSTHCRIFHSGERIQKYADARGQKPYPERKNCGLRNIQIRVYGALESYLKNFWLITFVASLLFFRLAESYSQLVKYYLDNSVEVDKRLNWQVKEIVWKGKPLLLEGVCTARVVARSRQQVSLLLIKMHALRAVV